MDLFDDVLLLEGNASAKGAAEGEVHGRAEVTFSLLFFSLLFLDHIITY